MSACRPAAPTSNSTRGASLLELILVSAMMTVFLAVVYDTAIVGLRVAHASDERENVRQQLAHALDLMTREISMASNVDAAQDQQLQLDADVNGDGTTENDILYQVQNSQLQRTYNGSTVTLVRDLASLDFNYADLNGADLATPVTGCALDRLRVMQVTMEATKDAETLSVASAAFLRNND